MKEEIILISGILQNIITSLDGRQVVRYNPNFYPPRMEFENIVLSQYITDLNNVTVRLSSTPTRSERIDVMSLDFQQSKIEELEERIIKLEELLTKYNISVDNIDIF